MRNTNHLAVPATHLVPWTWAQIFHAARAELPNYAGFTVDVVVATKLHFTFPVRA